MSRYKDTQRKVYGSIAAITALFLMLAITTYALVLSMVSVDGNLFAMGTIDIELNGGKTIFDDEDIHFEPGYSVKKDFTIENVGTADVYYRLYLEDMTGSLQESLIFEIYDGDKSLYHGPATDLCKETPCISDTPLAAGEMKTLTAVVRMSETAGNVQQSGKMTFSITVDAVQSKNNTEKLFD